MKFMRVSFPCVKTKNFFSKITLYKRFYEAENRLLKVENNLIDDIRMFSMKTCLQVGFNLRGVEQKSILFGEVK